MFRLVVSFAIAMIPLMVSAESSPESSPEAEISESCPVTLPNSQTPELQDPEMAWFGDDGLYSVVSESGVRQVLLSSADEEGGWDKYIFSRDEPGGELELEGKLLSDADAQLKFDIPEGYGLTGVQVVMIWFPTEGCWQIDASAGDSSFTIVTYVEFVDEWD